MNAPKLFDWTRLKLALVSILNYVLPFFIIKRLPLAASVNQERLRSSIKRIFRNSIKEVLGELFQNSQRAGSSRVVITTSDTGFEVADDGSGVNGIQGFHALIKIAETRYEDDSIELDQRPMGVGLCSLFSLEGVTEVTFSSGKLQLKIDTTRWFEDERYYRTWFDRLRKSTDEVRGFKITVACAEKTVTQLRDALKPKDYYRETSPAQGYEGILEIELDGKPVETRLPRWATITKVLVDTTYLGSRLLIGFTDDSTSQGKSTVNWYGQLVAFDFSKSFTMHLVVREGHPVNPRAPVREGLIENEAYDRLIQFAKDALFDYLFTPENRQLIQASWVTAFYRLDPKRALREAPYYVARPHLALENPGSLEDLDCKGESRLFAYADEVQPLLLRDGLTLVLDGGEEEEAEYGISTFIPQIGAAYSLEVGDPRRLPSASLYWRPGGQIKDIFHTAGEYGLSYLEEKPEVFLPVTVPFVFAFNDPGCWDVDEVDFTVGFAPELNTMQERMIEFLQVHSWAAFYGEHSESSWDELHDSFENSIRREVRSLVGNCVSSTFSLYDLTPFFSDKGARVAAIEVIYADEKAGAQALSVRSQTGETVRLSLMY